jgi:hypothetical protein
MKSKEMLFPKKKKTNVVGSKCMEFIVMLFSKERKPMCYGWFHVKETQRNVFFLNRKTNVIISKCIEPIMMLFSKGKKPMCYDWFQVNETQ